MTTVFWTLEQAADETGATDREVRRAIANETLEAYQCGRVVKVKARDVREWLMQRYAA